MEQVTMIGVTPDGEALLLQRPGGAKLRLPLDERVRVAVRGDRGRQLEMPLEGSVTPRRSRPGSGPDRASTRSSTPSASPANACSASPSRCSASGSTSPSRPATAPFAAPPKAGSLGDIVAERLSAAGGRVVDWDAWKGEDGHWVLVLVYSVDGRERTATFGYDPASRSVSPLDDDARRVSTLGSSPVVDLAARRESAEAGDKTVDKAADKAVEGRAEEPAEEPHPSPPEPASPA